jgi:hypothetical protein
LCFGRHGRGCPKEPASQDHDEVTVDGRTTTPPNEGGPSTEEAETTIVADLEIQQFVFGRRTVAIWLDAAVDAKELRRLKDENVRLKRLVADLTLDNQMLKEVARGNL